MRGHWFVSYQAGVNRRPAGGAWLINECDVIKFWKQTARPTNCFNKAKRFGAGSIREREGPRVGGYAGDVLGAKDPSGTLGE